MTTGPKNLQKQPFCTLQLQPMSVWEYMVTTLCLIRSAAPRIVVIGILTCIIRAIEVTQYCCWRYARLRTRWSIVMPIMCTWAWASLRRQTRGKCVVHSSLIKRIFLKDTSVIQSYRTLLGMSTAPTLLKIIKARMQLWWSIPRIRRTRKLTLCPATSRVWLSIPGQKLPPPKLIRSW